MKSFRVYIAPGRIPTAAGWCAILSGLSVIILGLFQPNLFMKYVSAGLTSQVKLVLVMLGMVTFGLVGGLLKLLGTPLSRIESDIEK